MSLPWVRAHPACRVEGGRRTPSRRGVGLTRGCGAAFILFFVGMGALLAEEAAQDNGPSVYLSDSFEAQAAVKRADQLAEAKRWTEASRAYREAVQKHSDKLIRDDKSLYVGVAEYVNRRIAAWPAEGVSAYSLLWSTAAQAALDDARASGNLRSLLRVADDYFCTPQGLQAGSLAAELAAETGDFALAIRLYRDLLARHPDREKHRVELTGQLAINLVWSGRADEAKPLVQAINSMFPQGVLRWRGADANPVEVIDREVRDWAPPGPTSQPAVWPVLGGNAQRNGVINSEVHVGAPLWEYGAKQGFFPVSPEPTLPAEREMPAEVAATRNGRQLTMVPITDGSTAYLCDPYSMWAIRLADGRAAWSPFSIVRASERVPPTPAMGEPARFDSCTLSRGRLLAVLGQVGDVPMDESQTRRLRPTLVCLLPASGRLVWTLEPSRMDKRLVDLEFDGPPLENDGRLYLVGRRQKRFGFEDCYLVCLDGDAGRLDWMTHIASASVGGFGYRRATLAIPSISEGTVYVCSNLGAVAAIQAHDGRIRWLTLYRPEMGDEEAILSLAHARRVLPWRYSPSICWRNRLICFPLDSDRAWVLDRADGKVIGQIAGGDLGQPGQILGIVDDVLYTAGSELVAWELVTGHTRWSRSLAECGGLLGRGQITRTHLHLPMTKGLFRFALKGGTPDATPWFQGARGGNVLVTADQVVVVGRDRVIGLAPKDEAIARLRRRIEQSPKDPFPWLDLSDVAYRIGMRDMAVDALRKAVEAAGGFARIDGAEIKARIFQQFITLGDRCLSDEWSDEKRALELYQQAAECPPDADGQVLYRLRLADLYVRTRNSEKAVEQYQQIISDRSLRSRSATPQGEVHSWPAGQWAERQIDRIIGQSGPSAYDVFEKQAAAILSMGIETGDLQPLEQVIDRFPNARAAREALHAKAQLLTRRGDFDQAVRAYVQVLNRSNNQADRPAIMQRIIETCLQGHRPAAARRWAIRAAKAFPNYRMEQGGRSIGFADLKIVDAPATPLGLRPKLSLPLRKAWSRRFTNWVTVLQPVNPSLSETRYDMIVVYCAGKVEAFTIPANRPMWSTSVACEGKPTLLGMAQGRMVLVTRRQLMGVDIATGKVIWSRESAPADADRPELDPENVPRWSGWAISEDRVVGIIDDGQAVCLDVRTGRESWSGKLGGRAGGAMTLDEEFLICETSAIQGPAFALTVFDAETGRPLRTLRAEDGGRALWMRMMDQGLLLVSTGNRVYAFDPYSGSVVWQTSQVFTNLRSSLQVGPAGFYLSQDGRTVVRYSTETGKADAESSMLPGGGPGALTMVLDGDRLFAFTSTHVLALDAVSLKVLWSGATDRSPSLQVHCVGRPYVVAIDRQKTPGLLREGFRHLAYFYDRRDDSGIIPADSGVTDLGGGEIVRGIHFADHSILVVDGAVIHAWTGPGDAATP